MRAKLGAALSLGLAATCLALTVGIAPPALRTLPAKDIRPGMRGYGLTVLRGTEPERFDVEVIDVLHNFRPDQDLVLIRTPHPILNHAGSVAGMSGSPVFIDDKLIGAYAYGWQFGKDPVAGVTPIANMLAELKRPLRPLSPPWSKPLPSAALGPMRAPQHAEPRHAYLGEEARGPFFALEHLAPPTVNDREGLAALATPLLLSGMTPEVSRLLEQRLLPLGFAVLEAGGSSGSKSGPEGPETYVNGGSIAVQLLSGDVQATAVGTVTYVDGKRLVAFGHPMLDAGEVRLPTATSRVLHVLASSRSSFKIAEALRPLGALVHDRQSAIVVDAETRPSTVPLRIEVRGLPNALRSEWRVQAVRHRMLTGPLVLSAVGSALGATLNDQDHALLKATTRFKLVGRSARTFVDELPSTMGGAQMSALGQLRVFDAIEAVFANPFEEAEIEQLEIAIEVSFGRRITELLSAQLIAGELDPGEPARLLLTLRPYGGANEQRLITVPVPATYAGESIDIEVNPGDDVRIEQPIAESLEQVLDAIGSRLSSTSLVVSVGRKSRGLSLPGQVTQALPGSMLDTLITANTTSRALPFVARTRTTFPLENALVGAAKLTLQVRKEKR